MTWLVVLAWLKRIPWQLWAAISLIVVLSLSHGCAYRRGASAVQTDWDTQKAADKVIVDTATAAARTTESRQAGLIAGATAQLKKDNADAQATLNRTIADLRRGTVRVRDRFTCQGAMPQAAGSASGSHPAGQGGLSVQDAEFLVRFAGEADAIASRLTACQRVIAADRQ